jgi:hypothetical protein
LRRTRIPTAAQNRKFEGPYVVSLQKRHGILHKGLGTSGFAWPSAIRAGPHNSLSRTPRHDLIALCRCGDDPAVGRWAHLGGCADAVQMKKQQVNFETDAYDFYKSGSASSLLTIVVGGGAYDLRSFTRFCLNGRQAWKTKGSDSGTVVAGEPGVNAVAVHWSNLSGQRLHDAQSIVSSIRINWGSKC